MDNLPDEMLMLRITSGDAAAFACLVRRHTDRFYRAAYRVVLNREDAEDIVQEAFCKLWNGKARWKEDKGAQFTTWFYRIVMNQSLDHVSSKGRRREGALPETLASATPSAEQQLMADAVGDELADAMANLPERQRVAVTLFYLEELSQRETADIMDITPKAVESLLGRAKQFLRERMQVYA